MSSTNSTHWLDEALRGLVGAFPYILMASPLFILGDIAARWGTLPAAALLSEHARDLGAAELSAVQRYAGFVLTVMMAMPVFGLMIAGGIGLHTFIRLEGEIDSEKFAWRMLVCLYLTPLLVILSALVPPVIDVITTYGVATPEEALKLELTVPLLAMSASLAMAIWMNLEILKNGRDRTKIHIARQSED